MLSKAKTFYQIVIIALIALNLAIFLGYFNWSWGIPSVHPLSGYTNPGEKLKSLAEKKVVIKSPISEFKIPPKELVNWLESYERTFTGKQEFRLNEAAVRSYLENLSSEISHPPVNARLVIENGVAKEFSPPQNGFSLDIEKSTANILTALTREAGATSSFINLIVEETKPSVTLDRLNTLGIDTLLGRGESDFTGSPGPRVHNIGVGADIFTGIILKPGEEFSFNQWLGPVDASAGYLPELVIKSGELIPEYGGGLCQISTTLFRAAVYAGLPITERRPHSLPVRYYNPQGFDATIYPGVTDLKFVNDTTAHILVQAKVVGSKIYFEIYGTSDGRRTTVDGPHQYDVQSSGALKAVLNRTVIYPDGTEKKDEFRSSYKSPSLFPIVRNPLE